LRARSRSRIRTSLTQGSAPSLPPSSPSLPTIAGIFAEFLTKSPLFASRGEVEAISQIFKLLGTPSDQDWPGWRQLPEVRKLRAAERQYPPAGLRKALRLGGSAAGFAAGAFVSDAGLELLQSLLTCDPARRATAAEALAHRFWSEAPAPCDPRFLPAFPSALDEQGGGGGGGGGGDAVPLAPPGR